MVLCIYQTVVFICQVSTVAYINQFLQLCVLTLPVLQAAVPGQAGSQVHQGRASRPPGDGQVWGRITLHLVVFLGNSASLDIFIFYICKNSFVCPLACP